MTTVDLAYQLQAFIKTGNRHALSVNDELLETIIFINKNYKEPNSSKSSDPWSISSKYYGGTVQNLHLVIEIEPFIKQVKEANKNKGPAIGKDK
ncbi:MAG: hypothetical protein FRX48_09804 [Lasallia pustulata]|uniref:Uncharacterized protein n=1 Tax=Lasallia pustulata TaxID=136370 RepID=A0A5M8PBH8_9LECA|nr:MAG: hypothetical protein FRX48_09804 [Lasallia pustulata]